MSKPPLGPPPASTPPLNTPPLSTPPLSTAAVSTPPRMQVYYDGGCPVCSREIAFYRKRPGADGFEWVDVHRAEESLGPGLSREAAIARLHVRLADGTLLSGAAAFAAMWRSMPGLRWLGRWLQVPPVGALAELAYLVFLRVRRAWRRPGSLA